MQPEIPFHRPYLTGKELSYISDLVNSGDISTDGYFTRACAQTLEERFGIYKVLMTPSCTAALEMAALLCDFGPGDEVILPSFTFVSTANAVVRVGAKPVFVDIRLDTLNLDEERVEQAISSSTKAIIPVHYGGVACELDSLLSIAKACGLRVIEDAAQALNSFYKGRALGSIGDLGTYSFHYTKNASSGEGGALCVNSPEMADRADVIRDKGTNRGRFLRGQVDKYTWVDVGSSYAPSEINSAFLYAQFEGLDWMTERRHALYKRYDEQLRPLESEGLIKLPTIPVGCASNYHIYYLLLPHAETRDSLITHLRLNGIEAVFHYVPLHSSPMGQKLGYTESDLPLTESVSKRLLRLPIYPDLTEEMQSRVIDCVQLFLRNSHSRQRVDSLKTSPPLAAQSL